MPYCADSVHRKGFQNFAPPLNNAFGFQKLKIPFLPLTSNTVKKNRMKTEI